MAAGATAIVLLGVAVGGFWQMLRSDRAAARAGVLAERTANRARRLLKRPPVHGWAEATTRFRNRTRDLLRSRGGWITAAALVSHLSLYLVLLVTLRHVGVGDAEVGWAQVTASVLVFRALTWLLPVPLGGLTYLGWRWQQHRRATPAAVVVPATPAEPRSPSP